MVILRAFPFSFSIYWRMLLVFPVIILALVVLGGVAGLLTLVLAMLLPTVIVAMLIFALCMSFYTTPVLVGMRMGLTALGHTPRNTYAGLWGFAAMYGLVLALLAIIVTALGMGVVGLVFGFSPLTSSFSSPTFMMAFMDNKTVIYSVLFVVNVIPFCIFAAMMMPMAASSVGKDSNGERHTPFAGFGQGFVSLIVLMLFAQIVNVVLVVVLPLIFAHFVGEAALSNMIAASLRWSGGELPRNTGVFVIGLVLPYLLGVMWTISLQCAGAVLVYADACDATPMPPAAPQRSTPEDGPVVEDIGAMWRNRMPTTN